MCQFSHRYIENVLAVENFSLRNMAYKYANLPFNVNFLISINWFAKSDGVLALAHLADA